MAAVVVVVVPSDALLHVMCQRTIEYESIERLLQTVLGLEELPGHTEPQAGHKLVVLRVVSQVVDEGDAATSQARSLGGHEVKRSQETRNGPK